MDVKSSVSAWARQAKVEVTSPGDAGYISFSPRGANIAQGLDENPEAMPRKLVWIKRERFLGFGCSNCDWVFNPSGALRGGSVDEMKEWYEAQCDKEFAAHVCTEHPRVKDWSSQQSVPVNPLERSLHGRRPRRSGRS